MSVRRLYLADGSVMELHSGRRGKIKGDPAALELLLRQAVENCGDFDVDAVVDFVLDTKIGGQ